MKKIPLLLLAAAAAAHEEANPPILQGLAHSLGIDETTFVFAGTAVVLFLFWLWKRV